MKPIYLIITFLIFSFKSFGQVQDSRDDGRTINIPVIVHVIYTDKTYSFKDSTYHKKDNISDRNIKNEVNDLHLDFLAKNDMSTITHEPFKKIVDNPNINFYLADTLLQQGSSKGIIRVKADNTVKPLTSKSTLINSKKYLNVYIGNVGNVTDLNGDFVTLSFTKIGKNTHVLTHETGHWLNLYHVWGRVGSCNWFKTLFKRDDYVDDTPPQRRCSDLSYSKCPPKNRATKRGQIANYNNFMDYSGCRCMFTKKQVIRMRNSIIKKRQELFNQ